MSFSASDPSFWVSTSALCVSVFSCWATIRHNKKSVQPNLDLMEHSATKEFDITIKTSIRNSGLGPAIFAKGTITFRGKTYLCSEEADIERLINETIPKEIPFTINQHETRIPGFMMIPNEEYCIAEITLHGPNEASLTMIKNAKKEMKLEVTYTSLYGEEFTLRN
jgi:hypothetical protein